MTADVMINREVTPPKAILDAAGIHPGDRVSVRLHPDGGIIVERERPAVDLAYDKDAYLAKLEAIGRRKPLRRGPFDGLTPDQIMQILRGDDE